LFVPGERLWARQWLLGDPLGRDGIAGREGLFHSLIDQLFLTLIQVFTGNPITRGAVGTDNPFGLAFAFAATSALSALA
jgi:hypothetical protein